MKSITPDQLFGLLVRIHDEVFKREVFRQTPVTSEEFEALKERWDMLYFANVPAKGDAPCPNQK